MKVIDLDSYKNNKIIKKEIGFKDIVYKDSVPADTRLACIQKSLKKINHLMSELKEMSKENERLL